MSKTYLPIRKTYSNNEDLLLEHIDIWNPDAVLTNQSVRIRAGKITAITPMADQAPTPSPTVLIPAGVDAQVHTRVPGQHEKETAETALLASIAGGVAALLTMPNTKPVIDCVEVLERAKAEFAACNLSTDICVLYSAAITMGQRGQENVDFKALAKAGVSAFTDDGVGVVKDDLMRQAFRCSAELGLPILQHAEFPGHGGVLAPGPVQEQLHLDPAYSDDAEVDMVARDIKLLAEFKDARYHVLHVSSYRTLEIVAEAKAKGLNVTCEVSPHHLLFAADDIKSENSAFKMNPPLRTARDREALQAGLRSGVVDFVATDHAPHEPAAKTTNFRTSAFGTTGLETFLRTLLWLHNVGGLSKSRVSQVFSSKPARFLGLSDDFGTIAVGQPARFIEIKDLPVGRPFAPTEILSHSKNSCFIGANLPGQLTRFFLPQAFFQL